MVFYSFTALTSVDCDSRCVTRRCYFLYLVSIQPNRVQVFFVAIKIVGIIKLYYQ